MLTLNRLMLFEPKIWTKTSLNRLDLPQKLEY